MRWAGGAGRLGQRPGAEGSSQAAGAQQERCSFWGMPEPGGGHGGSHQHSAQPREALACLTLSRREWWCESCQSANPGPLTFPGLFPTCMVGTTTLLLQTPQWSRCPGQEPCAQLAHSLVTGMTQEGSQQCPSSDRPALIGAWPGGKTQKSLVSCEAGARARRLALTSPCQHAFPGRPSSPGR